MKGQMTFLAIIAGILSLIMFVAMYPLIDAIIDSFEETCDDPALIMIVRFLPFVMFFGIIFGTLWYVFPQRQVQYGGY